MKKINSKSESESEPSDLRKALATVPKAKTQWDDLTPLARRDFVSWIESAKRPETHRRRIEKACSMLVAGKRRPCCYSIVPINLYKALAANPKAKAHWGKLTSTARRDLADQIEIAEGTEARQRRIKKVCEMLAAKDSV